MNKKFLVIILITMSVLISGCGNKNTNMETANNNGVNVSQSESSDNTIDSSTKTETTSKNGTLQDLKNQGFQIDESNWHTTHFENFGDVVFVGGLEKEGDNLVPKFYLTDNVSNILYEFPEFNGDKSGTFDHISSISFIDMNNDQLLDVIVTANYKTDKGLIAVNNIFFQNGKKFKNDKEYDDFINKAISNHTTDNIIDFAKKNPIK